MNYATRAAATLIAALLAMPSARSAGEETVAAEATPDPAQAVAKAEALLKDSGKPGSAQMAVIFLAQAAATGNAEAANRLGYLYDKGEGVTADRAKARECFQKAAEAGLPKAKFNYGRYLVLGLGGPADVENGLGFLEAAANEGVVPAQLVLAKTFFFGESGQKVDYKRAYPFALLAAETGDAEGQNMVGVMTRYGWGIKRNLEASVEWFRKAAEQGHAKAQASLADALLNGTGVKMDKAEAIKFYTLSANQGEVTGKNPLADFSATMDPAIIAEGTLRAEQFSAKKRQEKQ